MSRPFSSFTFWIQISWQSVAFSFFIFFLDESNNYKLSNWIDVIDHVLPEISKLCTYSRKDYLCAVRERRASRIVCATTLSGKILSGIYPGEMFWIQISPRFALLFILSRLIKQEVPVGYCGFCWVPVWYENFIQNMKLNTCISHCSISASFLRYPLHIIYESKYFNVCLLR